MSLAAGDGGASPSESGYRLPLAAPDSDVVRVGGSVGWGAGGNICTSAGLSAAASMDTTALRGEPKPPGGTVMGGSIADSTGKRVAGHPEGEVNDRGRETEESRCTAVSGNGGSSAFIVSSEEMYMLICSEPTPPLGGVVGEEHSVTSRNGGTIAGGFLLREIRDLVESIPCGFGRVLF